MGVPSLAFVAGDEEGAGVDVGGSDGTTVWGGELHSILFPRLELPLYR